VTTEEVYLRSFVTAAVVAAVVAFFVVIVGARAWKRKHERWLGIVGGGAIALAWIGAHIAMRGPPLGDLTHSSDAWRTLVWPPDVTRRFPVLLTLGCFAGVIAHLIPRKGIARWLVAWIAMGVIMWCLTEAMRRTGMNPAATVAISAVFALVLARVMSCLENAGSRDSGMALACGLIVVVIGTGIIQLVIRNYALGLVVLAGVVPIAIVGVWSRAHPSVMIGPVVPATIAAMIGIAFLAGFLSGEPASAFGMVLVLAGPAVLEPRFPPDPTRKRAWNGWLARFGLMAVMVASGVAIAVFGLST